jgi:MoaA/NifB/PqqE/SkfB family radical SAM enzyme
MLKDARLAIVTGSGDPFASKNFRQLIERMTADEFPDLRFQVMTNAMLLTEREWDNFPALHERTAHLRISIDAATGPTHEKLRRGAKWDVMERNLAFAGRLRAAGQVKVSTSALSCRWIITVRWATASIWRGGLGRTIWISCA